MSYSFNENFEPMFNQNYDNEKKFSNFINTLKGKDQKLCELNDVSMEKNKICMVNGEDNIEIDDDELYSGYCLPKDIINSINSNKINSTDELKTLNNCSNEVGGSSIYIGYKKSENPSLYGLKLSIKCENGENYICPIFNELSNRLMQKCEVNNGVVNCSLDGLTENEKNEIQQCLNMAGNECGLNSKIKVSYKCDNNNIVKEIDNIDELKLECSNNDVDKKEFCVGTSDNIEYNNYKMNLNECSMDKIPIYYNPKHKVDEQKLKEGEKSKLNYYYTKNYENAKDMYDQYKLKKNELDEIKSYAEENNIELNNVFEKLEVDSGNTSIYANQQNIISENMDELNYKISEIKNIIVDEDNYSDDKDLNNIKMQIERVTREIDRYKSNNERKKDIIQLLNKLLKALTVLLVFIIVYYGFKKGVISKNTQNKINQLIKNQAKFQ